MLSECCLPVSSCASLSPRGCEWRTLDTGAGVRSESQSRPALQVERQYHVMCHVVDM